MESVVAVKDQQPVELRVEKEGSKTVVDQQPAELREEVSRLTEQVRRGHELLGSTKGVGQVEFPLNIKWTRGPDMPFGMYDYIQSVLVQETVYVGGGYTGRGKDNFIVMAYNTRSRNWHQLPPYRAINFAMAAINNQLVLVGGLDRRRTATNLLGVWEADSRKWAHPYPPMPTARYRSSAVAYKQWLLVAGGRSHSGRRVSTVEVLNVDSKQWWGAPSLPEPLISMRSTRVGDMCYLMGGCGNGGTDNVYSVSLPALISHGNSGSSSNTPQGMWKIMSGLGHYFFTPLYIGGSLLAVGGRSVEDGEAVSTIRRYLPETEEWVRVGELPSPLQDCTCAVTSDGEVLLAGGLGRNHDPCTVYVGNFM